MTYHISNKLEQERGERVGGLQKIGNHEIFIKSYNGQRVVTLKDIDTVHERPDGTAKRNFNANKQRFIEGKHYFVVGSDEIRTSGLFPISDNDHTQKALITEQGYLKLVKSFNDDLAWEVQDQLVDSYFQVKQTVSEELSPQMQLLMQMVNTMAEKELADKERDRKIAQAKEVADKAFETTERMKEELISPFDNWRDDINTKVRKISKESKKSYQQLFTEMYSDLERIARCDLSTRQRNKRDRMERSGCTKTDIQKETTKIAVIEDDARLKQIFEDIVRKYGAKYIA